MQPEVERVLVRAGGHEVAADVHLRDDGRPPVLFLHGLLTTTAIVRHLFVDAEAASWVSVSLPGHAPGGLAPRTPPAAIDNALFADLVDRALFAAVGSRRVVATGWSTGGFAALNLAVRHPGRVAAVASFAGFASGRRITGAIAWLAWLARGGAGAAAVRAGLWAGRRIPWIHDTIVRTGAADAAAARAIPADTLAALRQAYAGHDPASLAAVLAAIDRLDIGSQLAAIDVPTWIVAGGRDPFVPVAEAHRLDGGIRGATLTIYDEGGHLFFHEWPRFRGDFAAWRAGLDAGA